jgi:hypothetical protein
MESYQYLNLVGEATEILYYGLHPEEVEDEVSA